MAEDFEDNADSVDSAYAQDRAEAEREDRGRKMVGLKLESAPGAVETLTDADFNITYTPPSDPNIVITPKGEDPRAPIPVEVGTHALPTPSAGEGLEAFDRFISEIADMEKSYPLLVVNGLEDKAGYALVKDAKAHSKTMLAMVEVARKEVKAPVLEWAARIDLVGNGLKERVIAIRDHLQAEQDKADNEADRIREEKRLEKQALTQARINLVTEAGGVVNIALIGAMNESAFKVYLKTAKEAKEQADYKAAEDARIRRLQDEAEATQKAKDIKEEEDRQAIVKKAQDAKQAELNIKAAEIKEAQDKLDAEKKAQDERDKADQIRKDTEACLAKETADKLESERVAKEAADKLAKEKAAEEALRQEAIERSRPDADRIRVYAAALRAVVVQPMTTMEGVTASAAIQKKLTELLATADELAQKMVK